MRILSIDLETYSSVDLAKCGVYAYTQAKDFEILLLAYAFDDEPVEVIDLASGEEIPDKAINALTNPNIIKSAFNANFERTCLAKHLNKPMPQEQWRCSQAHSLTLGLPASLKEVARCLKLSQQKMDEGKALIRYFSMPCRPTKANGGRTRNLPCHDRGKWETFKTYCKQDVVVERSIRKRLENYPMTDKELKLWYLDQKINDFGVKVDTTLVKNAIQCDEIYQKELMNEATELTGLENPNSPTQLKGWLKDNYNLEVKSLSKTKVAELLDEIDNPTVKRVLGLRQEMSKTSVRKYEAMDRAMGKDERIRGLLQFYGASTGRWCLAENTPVLVKTTDGVIAEKPIQNVSIKDMLWDGENWVNHSGVVFSGDKEVIAWDGVTATPEHIVYLSNKEKMTLREAKERGQLLWRGNTPFTN